MKRLGERSFWNHFHQSSGCGETDWYFGWKEISPLVQRLWKSEIFDRKRLALVCGCGTSSIGEELAKTGKFTEVVSFDFSEAAIEAMKSRRPTVPGHSYRVADARRLTDFFSEASVDFVLDKACLDALESDPQARWEILCGVSRCLHVGCLCLIVTSNLERINVLPESLKVTEITVIKQPRGISLDDDLLSTDESYNAVCLQKI